MLNLAEQKFFESLAKAMEKTPQKPISEMTIEEFRAAKDPLVKFTGPAADIQYQDIVIPCAQGHELRARYYQYDDKQRPLIIYYPGCGFVSDLFEPNHVAISKIAKTAGCHAIMVQFRLAPEHPFPAAFDDGVESTKYIFDHAKQFNANPSKIIIAGFSSGGSLTASVVQHLKQSSQYKIFHQLLIDGCYDYSFSLNSHLEFDQYDFLLSTDALQYLAKTIITGPEQLTDPRLSAYWSDEFHDLPETTMVLPECSRLRSQGEAYAEKLINAGNRVNKIIISGQTHNTMICREVMSDGDDPAVVAGEAIRKVIE